MIRKLLMLSLCAVPALAFGQESKPAACRTLEAAGGFLGPDEIIVNGLVCSRGTGATDAEQSTKSVPGVVISNSDAMNVVAAAKAANQRVAAAENAIKQKAAEAQEQSQPAAAPILTAAAPAPQKAPAAAQPTQEAAATAAPVQQPRVAAPAPVQNVGPQNPAADNASSTPAEIADPVANDAVGSFSDAMDRITSRDSQPATDPDPTLSAQKNTPHAGAETQPCAKNSIGSTKCVEVIGQVAEDLGRL
jgi:hypothetical protein